LLGLLDLSWVTAPPSAVTAVLATVLALAGSLLVAEVVRRSPASLPLTGRPRRRPQKPSVGSVTQQPESALSRKV
jgi:hypothetical protein